MLLLLFEQLPTEIFYSFAPGTERLAVAVSKVGSHPEDRCLSNADRRSCERADKRVVVAGNRCSRRGGRTIPGWFGSVRKRQDTPNCSRQTGTLVRKVKARIINELTESLAVSTISWTLERLLLGQSVSVRLSALF
jgi:hypothetical protein